VTIPSVGLPATNAGHVVGGQPDTTATSDPIDVTADAGIISVTLSLTPGVRLLADSLRPRRCEPGAVQIGITTVDIPKPQRADP